MRDALRGEFDAAIDDLERALRGCPDRLWAASVWKVSKDDPWMWPRGGVAPIPERTEESIQQMSAFWAVAYHCLWFLDFYTTTDMASYRSYEEVRGGPEEQGMAADGAAPIPSPVYPRDVMLRFLEHGRQRVRDTLATVTDADLEARCPPHHPHAAKTLRELLTVNLAHVREHGGDLLAFVERQV